MIPIAINVGLAVLNIWIGFRIVSPWTWLNFVAAGFCLGLAFLFSVYSS